VTLDEPGEHRTCAIRKAEAGHPLLLGDESVPTEPFQMCGDLARFAAGFDEPLSLLLRRAPSLVLRL